LEEASQKPVREIMSTWTKQMGYPVISVSARQDGSNRVITLSQEKFSVDGVLNEKDQQSKWLVPISIISQNNPKPVKVLLENRSEEVVLENVEPNEWIKLNPGMKSFYRVHYSSELFEQFQPSIVDKSLTSIDRLNLQNDLFAQVLCGKVNSDRLLKLLESYVNEDSYIVWDSIIECLGKLNKVLEYTDYKEVFHLYVRKLLSKIHAKVGNKPLKDEDHQTGLLRSGIISLLVACKDPQLLQEAKSQFEAHVAKISQINPDLRNAIYRAVASDCDDKTFETFFQLHRETELHEEKNRIARSLSATTDVSRIQRIIKFAMSEEVRNQDTPFVIISVAMSNKVGRDIAWNYFKENIEEFRKRYKSGSSLVRFVKYLPENFVGEEKLQEVSAFFASNPIPSTERTVKQTLENIKLNSDWLSRDHQIIKNYLKNLIQM